MKLKITKKKAKKKKKNFNINVHICRSATIFDAHPGLVKSEKTGAGMNCLDVRCGLCIVRTPDTPFDKEIRQFGSLEKIKPPSPLILGELKVAQK